MAPRELVAVCGFLLVAAVACGPRVSTNGAPRGYELDDPELDNSSGEADTDQPGNGQTATPVKAKWGQVSRDQLLVVLDQGPAAFLAGVELQPYFREQRFAGWQIVRFWPGDPRFAAVDIEPGDVVTAINGREIMKPQHLFEVWSELRDAAEIVVSGQRASTRFELRFEVVDSP